MRIVYHSFEGRYSDNPRAIHEALVRRDGDAHEHLWMADEAHAHTFPAEVATVPYGSPEAVAALEAADALVANTHTDVAWEKRPDTLYLQTWHGTPLKRIHWDVLWAPEGRLERLSRDVERWDVLLSPNAAATPLLRGAFRFEGEVLEAGYPRNDLLSAPDRDAVGARVRASLGIDDGQRVVLYTPTWRDDVVFEPSADGFALHLDVPRFADALGDDHVLLLRTHYMLTGRLQGVEHPAVRDVSFHPEIAELYLAADVLVTDYSSTMYDFAITGRPQLFYTYDLDDYRDRQRGFYRDFEAEVPGPQLATTDELIAALRDLPDAMAPYEARYAAFRERYCHLEDGHATERVLARLLAGVRSQPGHEPITS